MYEVVFVERVEKYLDKLNRQDKYRILNSLNKLRIRPQAYLTRLVGEKSYKFRVGDYRLIIDLQHDVLIVLVVKIGHRKKIYKR